MLRTIRRLAQSQAQLLVIDLQERLLPHIEARERVVSQTVRMIRAARLLELPICVTEQYPQGLGPTTAAVLSAAEGCTALQKLAFSVCGDEAALSRIRHAGRPLVLLAGIETHVCVLQTALDLLAQGMTPFVLADAVGSRRAEDRAMALQRMREAGAVISTVESVIYEAMGCCGTELFRRMLPIVREP
ncbi:MAG: hydrolase [Phycisphaerae bacterium]